MNTIVSRLAGIATLALAVLPLSALATNAYAAPASVQIADLNLATIEGQAQFAARVDDAASRACRSQSTLSRRSSCKAAVRAEMDAKAAPIRQAHMARSNAFAAR